MKKYFLTGLVTLLPLAVTIWVVHFFVDFLTKPFIGVVSVLTAQLPIDSPHLIQKITQVLILIGLFILTFIIGFVGRRFFFNQIIRLSDKILTKIPLVNKVYKTTKDIVNSLFSSNEKSFKQVVLLQFPYPGAFCIGLVGKTSPKTCSDAEKKELVSIYIPTTPNPSTGFLVMCEKKDLIFLNMKTEQAIKYVVSCAVIQPEASEE